MRSLGLHGIMFAPVEHYGAESLPGALELLELFLNKPIHMLAHMHLSLRKEEKWTSKQEEVFHKSKELLQLATALFHYSADRELILACDDSPSDLS